jgi:hypothetical protein
LRGSRSSSPGSLTPSLPCRRHPAASVRSAAGPHRRVKTTAIILTPQQMGISLGAEPIPAPEPFAGMHRQHLHDRPNLRTTGGGATTPWLFPSTYPGKHLDSQYVMKRLRALGVNLLGARNAGIRNLVAYVPPPPRRATYRLQLPSRASPRRSRSATVVAIRHLVVVNYQKAGLTWPNTLTRMTNTTEPNKQAHR